MEQGHFRGERVASSVSPYTRYYPLRREITCPLCLIGLVKQLTSQRGYIGS